MNNKEIHRICKKYGIVNYTIEDGLVNVDGDVHLYNRGFDKLPLRFGVVSGHFDCSYNGLISLNGSPSKVGKSFICSYNNLTSLKGTPLEVGDGFYCSFNKLASLEGGPKEVGYYFDCSHNKLDNLRGAPIKVGGDFWCYNNNKVLSYEKYLNKVNRLNKLKQVDVG